MQAYENDKPIGEMKMIDDKKAKETKEDYEARIKRQSDQLFIEHPTADEIRVFGMTEKARIKRDQKEVRKFQDSQAKQTIKNIRRNI